MLYPIISPPSPFSNNIVPAESIQGQLLDIEAVWKQEVPIFHIIGFPSGTHFVPRKNRDSIYGSMLTRA